MPGRVVEGGGAWPAFWGEPGVVAVKGGWNGALQMAQHPFSDSTLPAQPLRLCLR
jgi:hypothetical protein